MVQQSGHELYLKTANILTFLFSFGSQPYFSALMRTSSVVVVAHGVIFPSAIHSMSFIRGLIKAEVALALSPDPLPMRVVLGADLVPHIGLIVPHHIRPLAIRNRVQLGRKSGAA
jgi:hypothetical protein